MKQCSQCGLTYAEEGLNYCLTDGTPLTPIAQASQPTVTLPPPQTTQAAHPVRPKRSKTPIFIGLALIVLLALVGGSTALYLLLQHGKDDKATDNRQATVNKPATPKPTKTVDMAAGSPSATPDTSETPEMDAGKGSNPPEDDDEVTPISWGTQAVGFKNDVGEVYKFRCPPNGTAAVVWGSDVYTTDSSICTAAVHAGKITLKQGGLVTIEFRPGRRTYGSTERNGITTNTFGEFKTSFVFK